jgi:murein DD-endopeptidase MepM/ murein hydrolase activator NlpD
LHNIFLFSINTLMRLYASIYMAINYCINATFVVRRCRERITQMHAGATLAALFAGVAMAMLATPANAANATNATLPRELRVPGGVALLTVGDASAPRPAVTRDAANVWVVQRGGAWVAVVGIALSAPPGEHAVSVTRDGKTTEQSFTVKPKRYPVQKLTLNKAMVDPPPEVMARIERESAHLKTVRSTWRESDNTTAAFTLPAKGPLSSRFGVARVLNGQPRSPHAGLDVAVGTGTPVNAPADGIVIDTGDYYFCGKGVMIDHGNGLITLYCHLNEFVAKTGDSMKRGERIALSGGTGRSTAPHLHWTVYLNGVAVEPELFLKR